MTLQTCALDSRNINESMAGTALEGIEKWLLVEVPGAWPAYIHDTKSVGREVSQRLHQLDTSHKSVRVQFIRQPHVTEPRKLTCFVGVRTANRDGFNVRRLMLPDLDALITADLWSPTLGEPLVEDVYLVCTHGKRDPCCARWGVPVYQAMRKVPGTRVWQTSHLGGHRFAATLMHFPSGLCYGKVEPTDVRAIIDAGREGETGPLRLLRGRTSLSRFGQAAEIFTRQDTQNGAFMTWHEERVTRVDEDTWIVTFKGGTTARSEEVRIVRGPAQPQIRKSCDMDARVVIRPLVRG